MRKFLKSIIEGGMAKKQKVKEYSGKKKQQLINYTLQHPKVLRSFPGGYVLGYLLPGDVQNKIEEKFGLNKHRFTKISIAVDTTSSLIKLGGVAKILRYAIADGDFGWSDAIFGGPVSTGLLIDGTRGLVYCGWRGYQLFKKGKSTGAYFIEPPYRLGKKIVKKNKNSKHGLEGRIEDSN